MLVFGSLGSRLLGIPVYFWPVCFLPVCFSAIDWLCVEIEIIGHASSFSDVRGWVRRCVSGMSAKAPRSAELMIGQCGFIVQRAS